MNEAAERRRLVIGLMMSAVAACLARPLAAQERPALLRVGAAGPNGRAASFLGQGYMRRMADLGYVEGKNYEFNYIDLHGQPDRYGEAMQELVRRKYDVIIAFGPEAALQAAIEATTTVPIVMAAIDYDPLAKGYVTSLARPAGNVTGVILQQIELAAKRLQLVQDAFPATRNLMVFWDKQSEDQWRATQKTAAKFGIDVADVQLTDYPYDYEWALGQVPPDHRGFLLMTTSSLFARDRVRLVEFTTRHKLPSMSVFGLEVEHGALMSYGPNRDIMSRRVADYVNRIARGAKPAELPIEQPTTFELVINLKTAKALGVELSPAILLRADKVIE
jgi:putative ABC transport system substrate-binding protein